MKISKYYIGYSKNNDWFYFGISKYWHDELIYISISKLIVVIDNRKHWIRDMVGGGGK
jgi:hypothetical protein